MMWTALVLCTLGVVTGTPASSSFRDRRSTFLNIVGERSSGYNNLPVLPVELPIKLGGHGGTNLPILVLPVPVFTKASDTCNTDNEQAPVQGTSNAEHLDIRHSNPPYVASRQSFSQPSVSYSTEDRETKPQRKQYKTVPQYREQPQEIHTPTVQFSQPSVTYSTEDRETKPQRKQYKTVPQYREQPQEIHSPTVQSSQPSVSYPTENRETKPLRVQYKTAPQYRERPQITQSPTVTPQPQTVRQYVPPIYSRQPANNELEYAESELQEDRIPFSEGREEIFATSDELIQSFRRQKPKAPGLAAVVPSRRQLPERIPVIGRDGPSKTIVPRSSPPLPDFGHSLHLRIDLTVPRSDYTEAYDIEWHAQSNTARTVVEDGATVIYRVPLLGGRVQFLKIHVDRTNGTAVRRCTMSPILSASSADAVFPGLPDLSSFKFIGYTTAEGRMQVERWQHVVVGKPGEYGAAQGESLNFTHEMLIIRDRGDAVPLRYSVNTDSSVLGPAIDSYTHRYQLLPAPEAAILPNTSVQCDVLEDQEVNRRRRQLGRLVNAGASIINEFNPLRAFTGLGRPSEYDEKFTDFTDKFQRKYRDPKEEAVRKAQYINTDRFVKAANRMASSFGSAINFMADRVDEELEGLFGAIPPAEGVTLPGAAAPEFSHLQAQDMAAGLPKEFDWRTEGAVTEVRYQASCRSCWAFAVAGSVEGALFNKTKKLVSLSPQSVIDCWKESKGCKGGWPSDAYEYAKDPGLPTWDSYIYKNETQMCMASGTPVVTRINDFAEVQPNSDAALKVAIYQRAPAVVIVGADTKGFKNHDGTGYIDDMRCTKKLDHAILAIGWKTDGDSTQFIIKNSWSPLWAKGGFALIDSESCGILETPSYALLDESNVNREVLDSSPAGKPAVHMPL